MNLIGKYHARSLNFLYIIHYVVIWCMVLEKSPVCSVCGALADTSFASHRLNVKGEDSQFWVILIYCKNCGAVQGVVNARVL